tara:strand:- start:6468 stop:6680 length:213 start_codon:yes stop_codon:yes gene_type:complete
MDALKTAYLKFSQSSMGKEQSKPVKKTGGLLSRTNTDKPRSDAPSSDRGKLIAETAFSAIRRKRQEIRNG